MSEHIEAMSTDSLIQELEYLGKKFTDNTKTIIPFWLNGTAQIAPESLLDPSSFINNWIGLEDRKLSLKAALDSDVLVASVYNEIIKEHARLSCQLQGSPACTLQNTRLLGLAIALRRKEKLLESETGLSSSKAKVACLELINISMPNPILNIAVQMLLYEHNPKAIYLRSLGYIMDSELSIFVKNENSDIKREEGLVLGGENIQQRLVNSLLVNSLILTRSLERITIEDGYRTMEIASGRLDLLYPAIYKMLKTNDTSSERSKFGPRNLYEKISPLGVFYENNANFIKANEVKVTRGWLRANFSDVTPTYSERIFLKIWGYLTAFGTTMIPMTLFFGLAVLVTLVFTILNQNISNFSFLESITEVQKIITLRGSETLSPKLLRITLEVFFMIFIPTYFGYLVTFLLSWR